jgi:hypothetical protein
MLDILKVLEVELGHVRDSRTPFGIQCPFHSDHDPSCRIYPDSDDGKGSFYCFGCGASGDALGFVRKYRSLTWPDLIEYVRTCYGEQLGSRTIEWERDRGLAAILYGMASSGFLGRDRLRAVELEKAVALWVRGDSSALDAMLKKSCEDGI